MVGGRCVKTGSRDKHGSIPGWNEEVEPIQDDARFWHSIWRSASRPNTGVLHIIIAKTKKPATNTPLGEPGRQKNVLELRNLFEASEFGSMDLLKSVRKGGKTSAYLPENVAGANIVRPKL